MSESSQPFERWRHTFDSSEYNSLSVEDDIYYCYRLLLGRNPDLHGFQTYQSNVQNRPVPVAELVEMFLSSEEYRNRTAAKQLRQPFGMAQLAEFRMYASPEDWAVGKHILTHGIYEPHVTQAVRRVLQPGMSFLDIGANIGYFTLLARSTVGSGGRVYAFEPSSSNCALLQLNLQLNEFDDVEVFPYALANVSRLFVYDHQGSNGTLGELPDNLTGLASRTMLRSVVFDQVLSPERCDVIKIDVEGAEWMALQGALKTIRRHHPAIFSEFSPDGLRRTSKVTGTEYLEFLFREGYRVSVIQNDGVLVDHGQKAESIIETFEAAQTDHIDILATWFGISA